MITAKNYAAQAEYDLNNHIKTLKSQRNNKLFNDILMLRRIRDVVKQSVKFVVPDNGTLLDDGFRGLIGETLHLPYPCITIEYYQSQQMPLHGTRTCSVFKRLIIAEEICIEEAQAHLQRLGVTPGFVLSRDLYGDKPILIQSLCLDPKTKLWSPLVVGWLLPIHWSDTSGITTIINTDMIPRKGNPVLIGCPFPVFASALAEATSYMGAEEAIQSCIDDINPEVGVLVEFLEALSCKNVSIVNYQDEFPRNIARIRDEKLPFYETKMLVIDSQGSSSGKSGTGGGSHASPRQHLRRGHIRRLSSGNIWVNSCVVGDPTKGSINKSYQVI